MNKYDLELSCGTKEWSRAVGVELPENELLQEREEESER